MPLVEYREYGGNERSRSFGELLHGVNTSSDRVSLLRLVCIQTLVIVVEGRDDMLLVVCRCVRVCIVEEA